MIYIPTNMYARLPGAC